MMRKIILIGIATGLLSYALWQGTIWKQAHLKQSLVAELRQGTTQSTRTLEALRQLVAIDARDALPVIKEEFARREKETLFLEPGDLRLQLLTVLTNWLPDKEVVPFLIAVDSDAEEAPQVRFRAVVLLCERGDAPSLEYLAKQHIPEAEKVEPLLSIESLEKSLKDRRLFASDAEFADLKSPGAEALRELQKGIQLAQHIYTIQRRGETSPLPPPLRPAKVQVRDGRIESFQFYAGIWTTWYIDLRQQGDHWLPCRFFMYSIE